jgi:hypothetical protein
LTAKKLVGGNAGRLFLLQAVMVKVHRSGLSAALVGPLSKGGLKLIEGTLRRYFRSFFWSTANQHN